MLQNKAHILLVDGEVKPSSTFSIISFPGVRVLAPKRFAILEGSLLELVKVGPSTPSSWFIDQIVRSDGSIVVASSFDPLFLLLPALEASSTHFSPLGQILESFSSSSSSSSSSSAPFSSPQSSSVSPSPPPSFSTGGGNRGDLSSLWEVKGLSGMAAKVCDVREGFTAGEENSLLRLNREKTLSVLSAKVLKLARALQERANVSEAKSRSTLGSFSTVSKAIAPLAAKETTTETTSSTDGKEIMINEKQEQQTSPPLLPLISNAHMESALSLIAEYVSDSWVLLISTALKISLASVAPHLIVKLIVAPPMAATSPDGSSSSTSPATADEGVSASTTPAISRWNQVAANDPLSELERFTHQKKGGGFFPSSSSSSSDPSSSSATATSGKLKPGMGAQSQANKKLANTAVKGLRSVASFFKPAPKDKK